MLAYHLGFLYKEPQNTEALLRNLVSCLSRLPFKSSLAYFQWQKPFQKMDNIIMLPKSSVF